MESLAGMTAVELVGMIRSGRVSSFEVVSFFIDRIERNNRKYNAVITLNKVQALKQAKKADEDLASGVIHGKLHGLPVTIKDNYRTRGIRTTAGFMPLKDYIPSQDAALVSALKQEGAIILGKTNLAILALDVQSNNKVFGRTRNPWNTALTSGGSSGGCATALAAGMTPLSFGNDLAGSIRIPANFCGVYGFMPTYGTTSLKGVIADPYEKVGGVRSLAAAGPLARSIDDIELALDIIAGPTEKVKRIIPLTRENEVPDIKDLRIAWTDSPGGVPVENEIKSKIKTFAETLMAAGAKVTRDVPDIDFYSAWRTWGKIVGMQGGYIFPNILRFFGSIILHPFVKNVPMHKDIPRPVSLKKYMAALSQQDGFISSMERFFDDYDAFICPVNAVLPFPHHEPDIRIVAFNIYNKPLRVNGGRIHYYIATQGFTIPFNLTESPVLAMPIGLSSNHLPVGIQVVGKRYSDFRLLKVAKVLDGYRERFEYPDDSRFTIHDSRFDPDF